MSKAGIVDYGVENKDGTLVDYNIYAYEDARNLAIRIDGKVVEIIFEEVSREVLEDFTDVFNDI